MMKSKKLLMVTTAYPFGHGESFVEAELKHIDAYFEHIEVVPSCYKNGIEPREMKQVINLDYVKKRWSFFRKFNVLSSLIKALCTYRWLGDAARIFRGVHRYENFKELARALYRAQLFEEFLEHQFSKNKKIFDVIYFYWLVPEIMGAIEFRRHSKFKVEIVSRAHNGDLYEDQHADYIGLRDSIVAGIDRIYCISDHGNSYLIRKYSSLTQKFYTARLGVNDPGYLNVQPIDGILSIVTCSFVVACKRLHLIVDAIDFLLMREPGIKIRWTHIGDGELYDDLRSYVLKKIEGRAEVIFSGYLNQSQVAALYRNESFDVIVNVSENEGIPVSLMEASSVGIPMIATDVGGNGEIVNENNGILIPVNSSIETIAVSLFLFKDKENALRYREGARYYWSKDFSAQVNYNKFGMELINNFPSSLEVYNSR